MSACKNTSIGGIIIPHTGMFNCSTDIETESSQRRDCVTDHDSMHMVNIHMCVTTKGTRGSGDPGVAGRGASRNLGTLELGSLRGPTS